MHATTVLCVRKDNTVVIIGDGQVTLGSQIMKPNVRKVRRLGEGKKVIAGFAGTAVRPPSSQRRTVSVTSIMLQIGDARLPAYRDLGAEAITSPV